MSERHIELVWRCSSCRHQNLGRHMVCQGCGNPKDDSEEYEMPADPSQVASVEDEKLLEMARAGENWSCAYCGSNARDLDGSCKQCGAGRKEGANARDAGNGGEAEPPREAQVDTAIAARPAPRRRFGPAHVVLAAIVAGSALVVGCLVLAARRPSATAVSVDPVATANAVPVRTDFTGEVTFASWSRSIVVERWQLTPHEAFTSEVPEGGLQVTAAGQRVHHQEEVFDHDETAYDDVTVPDGYAAETYTERAKCGEDCTTTPRSCRQVCTKTPRTCRQVCTNKKNGFASCRDDCSGGTESCHDDCSGGDRSCTPRYCSETKTRQIPKTRVEKRPRIVKKYRSEPRYAAWSTYRTWEWVEIRHADESGNDAAPRWPDAGAVSVSVSVGGDAGGGAPKPNAEREVRSETLVVSIRTDDGRSNTYTPASEDELARLAPGTKGLKVRVMPGSGTITLL